MKIRIGFVSNSSTSCFLITNKTYKYVTYINMFRDIVEFYGIQNIITIPSDDEYAKIHKKSKNPYESAVLINKGQSKETTSVEGFENEQYDFRSLYESIIDILPEDVTERGLRTDKFAIKWQYYNG